MNNCFEIFRATNVYYALQYFDTVFFVFKIQQTVQILFKRILHQNRGRPKSYFLYMELIKKWFLQYKT